MSLTAEQWNNLAKKGRERFGIFVQAVAERAINDKRIVVVERGPLNLNASYAEEWQRAISVAIQASFPAESSRSSAVGYLSLVGTDTWQFDIGARLMGSASALMTNMLEEAELVPKIFSSGEQQGRNSYWTATWSIRPVGFPTRRRRP